MSKKDKNPFLIFIGAGLQMTVIIVLGILGGKKLDQIYPQEKSNLFTIIGTMLSVVLSMVLFIKKSLDITKRNQ